MAKLEVKGRAAVITGAASGIGRALAMDAAMRGMSVGIADVNAEGLQATEAALREQGADVVSRVVDVRSAEAVEAFAAACAEAFPSIAQVWANAGLVRWNFMSRLDLADWNLTFDVNLRGVVHCIAAFLPRLIEAREPAQFIMTGSGASFVAVPEIAAYCATKHAVWALADALRQELAMEDSVVRASLLIPPRTHTGLTAVTLERTRAAKGEEGLRAFIDNLPTAEAVANYAMDKVADRDFLILPFHDDGSRNAIASRFNSVMEL